MNVSVGLILLIAAVLPGIIALFAFYAGISTAEIRVSPPPLNSVLAISLVGVFAVLAHLLYVAVLSAAAGIPWQTGLPLADPYKLVNDPPLSAGTIGWSLLGLIWITAIGFALGRLAATIRWRSRDALLFGWLLPLIEKAEPEINYINAYVLSNIQNGRDILGYEGAVLNLSLDADKNIIGIVLRDVESFYARMAWDGSKRISGTSEIATLALTKDDFQNVALDVVRDEGQLD